ncbi:MAG TPA: SGNH/GDSL hydrolase family protein [Bacteroidia bacterium]|jgi:acyl-CoA thioesterase-1|nr:SGNH/GDSL hydrolase family protein [Bacteroidia bacterium]
MRTGRFILLILIIAGCMAGTPGQKAKLKYVALGDSYTCCEGAKPDEAWPLILTSHLNEKGVSIELSANPARTGWTTQDLIDRELPIMEQIKPDFVTLLIGVNDWVHGVDSATFHKNLVYIIDNTESQLSNKKNLVLITIPDFGVTPTGAQYSGGRDIAKGIADFNSIIIKEVNKRGLKYIDIYPETKKMKNNPDLIASDGLHPSAKEYALWEKLILPVVYTCLK